MPTLDSARRLQNLSRQARPYPSPLLAGCDRGLCVFSAAYLGWNDVIHFARAGIICDCVDNNKERLWEMETIYPEGWAFHVEDAWDFAAAAIENGRRWDAISLDPFFDSCAQKVWASINLWLSLAEKVVTVTVHADTELDVPDGWEQSYFPRGENVGWMVLQRA